VIKYFSFEISYVFIFEWKYAKVMFSTKNHIIWATLPSFTRRRRRYAACPRLEHTVNHFIFRSSRSTLIQALSRIRTAVLGDTSRKNVDRRRILGVFWIGLHALIISRSLRDNAAENRGVTYTTSDGINNTRDNSEMRTKKLAPLIINLLSLLPLILSVSEITVFCSGQNKIASLLISCRITDR